jgi:UDP-N-acetylglucosamine/UDP-N-acetylgalactosamine diphosphorylase
MKYLNELDKDLYEALSVNNQLHLIRYLDELSAGERELLINDLKQIDFAEVNQFFARTVLNESKDATETSEGSMQPVPAANKGGYESSSPAELASYELDGLRAIAENKCAVILLAGGQGTRLGVSYPKGMYSVDLLSKKTLYQLQAERLIKVKQLADAKFNNSESSAAKSIPWYMMTSEATKELTREFFSQHGYFGLSEDSVVLFEQGMLPCLNKEGKIILDEKFKVSKAPDGNGGLYRALAKRGVLQDMAKRGVEYVQVYCVDNILVRMADPVFFGFCIQKNANCAAKVYSMFFCMGKWEIETKIREIQIKIRENRTNNSEKPYIKSAKLDF